MLPFFPKFGAGGTFPENTFSLPLAGFAAEFADGVAAAIASGNEGINDKFMNSTCDDKPVVIIRISKVARSFVFELLNFIVTEFIKKMYLLIWYCNF